MRGFELALNYANDWMYRKALLMKNMDVVVSEECIAYREKSDRDNILLEIDGNWKWEVKRDDNGKLIHAGWKQIKRPTITQRN
jgi:hypothetical protein